MTKTSDELCIDERIEHIGWVIVHANDAGDAVA